MVQKLNSQHNLQTPDLKFSGKLLQKNWGEGKKGTQTGLYNNGHNWLTAVTFGKLNPAHCDTALSTV